MSLLLNHPEAVFSENKELCTNQGTYMASDRGITEPVGSFLRAYVQLCVIGM